MEVQALTTGDGIVTPITRNYVPQFVEIGGVDVDSVIKGLEVSIGGKAFQTVSGLADIIALSKVNMNPLLGADVKIGQVFRIADGFIPNQTFTIRLTNSGVTTPLIYFNSFRKGSRPVLSGQVDIQSNSSMPFDGFTQLIFDPTNLNYAEFVFADGHNEPLNAVELLQRFAILAPSDADGKLGTRTVIDNSFGDIRKVTLFTTSGGDITVTKVQL